MNHAFIKLASAFMLFGALAAPADVFGAEWGSIKGRFVVDGQVPEPKPLVVTKDQFCMDEKPIDHTVVVSDDGGLANAVVYLRLGRRDKIEVHPDYASAIAEPVVLDNNGCEFLPHVTLLHTGQPLTIKNSDPVGHNTNLGLFNFNQTIPSNDQTEFKIEQAKPLPLPVVCNIHPHMKGYMLVQEHPYMAVSAEDGTFEIKNIPAGKREFQFWHESGYVRDAAFKGGETDRRGRADITVKAGETLDLGDIKVPASALK